MSSNKGSQKLKSRQNGATGHNALEYSLSITKDTRLNQSRSSLGLGFALVIQITRGFAIRPSSWGSQV
uniref:Uncharacterized protein n=1 Tax=Helianthus annuus TaxID=4232 RepID=A0A251UGV5_HELAN